MFSAILLGYKLDFLLDTDSFEELSYLGFRIIEDTKNCCTYIGERISEKREEGGEEIVINFKVFHDTKDALLAAVAQSEKMSSWVKREGKEMTLWHINLEC